MSRREFLKKMLRWVKPNRKTQLRMSADNIVAGTVTAEPSPDQPVAVLACSLHEGDYGKLVFWKDTEHGRLGYVSIVLYRVVDTESQIMLRSAYSHPITNYYVDRNQIVYISTAPLIIQK